MLDHARAGDLAVLGDMADQDHAGAGELGEADQRLRRAAHLGHRAGRRFGGFGPHGLDRIDHHQGGTSSCGKRGDDVLDGGFRREFHRRVAQAQPFGAQPHLGRRLFAGNIDDALAAPRQRGAGLDQQGRFADARLAADQQHRARHEAAAGDAVKLGHAGQQARRAASIRRSGLQAEKHGPCARCARPARRCPPRAPPRPANSIRCRLRICPASARRPRRNSGR